MNLDIIDYFAKIADEITTWRQGLHQNPETAFEEFETSNFVAKKLDEFNVSYTRNWAKTGIVATIHGCNGDLSDINKTIALRADMDALDIVEETGLPYASCTHGKMHGCGHDGHTVMLLAAAKCLSEHKDKFDGTIHFIFQPAEESAGGARVMIEEGFFNKYPCKAIFGMHNWPDLPLGKMGIAMGAFTASSDTFNIKLKGKSGHAAMPHNNIDVVTTATNIINALQNIVSREINPVQNAVISITKLNTIGSESVNVMPEYIKMAGTVRCFEPTIRKMIENRIEEISKSIANYNKCEIEYSYKKGYPPVINSEEETNQAIKAACKIVGRDNVITKIPPTMGAEDFAYFLEKCSGAYIALGQSDESKQAALHNSKYDFNDKATPIGASYWVNLALQLLPLS